MRNAVGQLDPMKLRIGADSFKGLLIHVGVVAGVLALLSIIFFYKVLPSLTNKGNVVTVPDLTGMTMGEAAEILRTKDLEYVVADSSYSSDTAPLIVLEQYPKPSAIVKIHRKINIGLNARIPPSISYPDLTGSSYDIALGQLRSLDVRIGTVEYQQDIADNSILESKVNDKVVQVGQLIPKGTRINLIVGRDSLKLKK